MNQWFSTTAAAEALNLSPKQLLRYRKTIFKARRHYLLKNPTAYRPTYTWHVDRCRKVLEDASVKAERIEQSQAAAVVGRGTQLPFIEGVEPYEIE